MTSDLDRIVAAYEKWGENCSKYLIGEIAFILWDARRQQLVASRDALGIRELFYSRQGDRLELSSQSWQLRPHICLEDLDPSFLAGFLARGIVADGTTPIKGVQRLPAGHTLIADAYRFRVQETWFIGNAAGTGAFKTSEEYLEGFKELFEEAVQLYLNHPGKVSAELSGGLDSSAIVSVASQCLHANPSFEQGLETVTLTWPGTPQSDESDWARVVARSAKAENTFVSCDDAFFANAEGAALLRNEPHFGILCGPMYQKEVDHLTGLGVDVLLSGSRAEAVVLDDIPPLHLADHFKRGRFARLWKELPGWQRVRNEPLSNIIYWNCVRPLLTSRPWDESIDFKLSLPPFLNPEFSKASNMEERIAPHMPRRFRSVAKQYQFELIGHSEQMVHRGHMDLAFECRYPFLYRPLVEYCFQAPWEVKHRPGRPKTFIRDGLRDVLPQAIADRKSFTSPTYAAFRTLQRDPARLNDLEEPLLAEVGAVDRKKWNETLSHLRHGKCYNFAAFTSSIAFEYWIRAQCS